MKPYVCLLAVMLLGCSGSGGNSSGGSGTPQPATNLVSGKWTIHASSTVTTGSQELVLVDFNDQGGGSFYASQTVLCHYTSGGIQGCTGALVDNQNSTITGVTSSDNLTMTLNTFDQNNTPCAVSISGKINGQSMSGSYNGCNDNGTWSGTEAASASGTYTGTINSTYNPGLLPVGFTGSITEVTNYTLTGSANLTGSVCFTSLTFGSPSVAVGEGVLLVDATHGVTVVAAPSEPAPNVAYIVEPTQYCGSDAGTGSLTKK